MTATCGLLGAEREDSAELVGVLLAEPADLLTIAGITLTELMEPLS